MKNIYYEYSGKRIVKTALILICVCGIFRVAAHSSEIDIGLSYLDGVSRTKNADIGFKSKKNKLAVSGNFKYAKQDGKISENSGYAMVAYDPKLKDRWFLWFFEKQGYDRKRVINMENFFGGGLKYETVSNDKILHSLSGGILSHYLKYENESAENMARFSLRSKFFWRVAEKFSFYVVAFYQPNMRAFGDYLSSVSVETRYSVSDRFGLKLKIEDSYRSVGITEEKNSFSSVLALSVKLGKSE